MTRCERKIEGRKSRRAKETRRRSRGRKGEISWKGEKRKTERGDKLRDKFELLLGLLRATARIQDSVNYAPKYFIIKHFVVLIVALTIAARNEMKTKKKESRRCEREEKKGVKMNNASAGRLEIHRDSRTSE